MKRRSFITSTVLAGAAMTSPSLSTATSHGLQNSNQVYYELRTYSFSDLKQQQLLTNYFKQAAIPAYNRAGISNIGVFTALKPSLPQKLYVLIPYQNLNQFEEVGRYLDTDNRYQEEGAAYLQAPPNAPAYDRIESSLLRAFAGMPTLEVPEAKNRIFELRQYQSASESAGAKKIDMFNNLEEIAVFKRLGFRPVFFGETLIGSQRPNLTYMITFDDMAAHDRLWKAFGGDPEWKKISAIPEYADALIVSKIISTFIVPTDFSQI